MRENLPSGTEIKIHAPENPIESTWQAMSGFYKDHARENQAIWLTKADYDEFGPDHVVRTFGLGNRYA